MKKIVNIVNEKKYLSKELVLKKIANENKVNRNKEILNRY